MADLFTTPAARSAQTSFWPLWIMKLLGALTLGIAVLLIYLPALNAPFIFDDTSTIFGNSSIRRLWPLVDFHERSGPLTPPPGVPTAARPIVNLTLALNYHVGETNPAGYRAVNMFVHWLAGLLLWAIVYKTLCLEYFGGRFSRVAGGLSFAAALLWVVHPLQTESVAYVTQRTESLMGLCFLATFYASLRYWEASSRGSRGVWLSLATLACLLGMLSKEVMITVLAVLLLYERTFLTGSFTKAIRDSWPLYLGLGCGAAALFVTLASGPPTPETGFGGATPAAAWWSTQCKIFFLYAKLTFWPWPLAIHYELPYLDTVTKAWPWVLSFALFVLASSALAWKKTAVGFVGVWILAVLSPTLIVPLPNEMAAERRMYVPLAAIAPFVVVSVYSLVGWIVQKLSPSGSALNSERTANRASAALVTTLVILLTALSMERMTYYQDELALFLDVIRTQPDNYVARVNIGTLLLEHGRGPEALEQFDQALIIKPDSVRARFNRAKLLVDLGRPQEALDEYRETVRLDPRAVEARYNYALVLESMGQSAAAIDQYFEIVELDTDYAAAHTNLAIALARLGKMPMAIEHFERALAITPDVESYANLAAIYQHVGRRDEAIETIQKGIALARSEGKYALATELEQRLQTYGR